MSNFLPPLAIPTRDRINDQSAANITLPSISSWSDGYRSSEPFGGSSPRSSSPPMTPFSARSNQNFAFIQSSPHIPDEDHGNRIDDIPSVWDRNYMRYSRATSQSTSISYTSSNTKSSLDGVALPSTSLFQNSIPTDHGKVHFRDYSDISSDVTSRHPSTFYDSEEEDHEDEDGGFSFVGESARATFFRTSAERGQWRNDPMALKVHNRLQMRMSAPTRSPPPIHGLKLNSRPISEPAHSTSPPSMLADISGSHDELDNPSELPSTDAVPSDHLNPEICDPHSLVNNMESCPEPEPRDFLSSPLPPSSPPLSPMSSPVIRSMSPLSFASSPPCLIPSSPLSFASSIEHGGDIDIASDVGDDDDGSNSILPAIEVDSISGSEVNLPSIDQQECEMSTCPTNTLQLNPNATPIPLLIPIQDPKLTPILVEPPECLPVSQPESSEIPMISSQEADPIIYNAEVKIDCAESAIDVPMVEHHAIEDAQKLVQPEDKASITSADKPNTKASGDMILEASAVKGSDIGDEELTYSRLKGKRKKLVEEKLSNEGLVRKKARKTPPDVPTSESRACSKDKGKTSKLQGKGKTDGKRRLEDIEEETSKDVRSSRVKRPKKDDAPRKFSGSPHSRSDNSKLTASLNISSPKPRSKVAQISAFDTEIRGWLIESMATSRASCLPASSLCKSVLQCRPSLKDKRDEKEWMEVFERVLQGGEASRGSGIFGKVESSGKDDSDRPLEAQWFYVPELDDDQERATLIRSMMPRPGKRSVTKKYKQYYYRPLEKISRWDPEDEI